LNNLKNSCK